MPRIAKTLSEVAPSDREKERYIKQITPYIPVLRAKARISQDGLAGMIGLSRQTMSGVERNIRPMSWNTYLALLFFFEHNDKTRSLLHDLELVPQELLIRFNSEELPMEGNL